MPQVTVDAESVLDAQTAMLLLGKSIVAVSAERYGLTLTLSDGSQLEVTGSTSTAEDEEGPLHIELHERPALDTPQADQELDRLEELVGKMDEPAE